MRTRPLFVLLLVSLLLTACFDINHYSRPDTSANLTGLGLSVGRLDQVFQMRAASYTSTQDNAVTSVRVIPTAENAKASIKVDDQPVASGAQSQPIALAAGEATHIGITVLAEDGTTTRSYDVTVTRQAVSPFLQEALLKAATPQALARFGYSIAVSGDTLAVGAPYETGAATADCGDPTDTATPPAGAVYVFVRNGGSWTQQARIPAPGAAVGQCFGWSVSLSGDTLAVGAPFESDPPPDPSAAESPPPATRYGTAYVFVRSGGTWNQQAVIEASATGLADDHHAEDRFGWSVAVSGDTLAVGAPFESSNATGIDGPQDNNFSRESGAVYVFDRSAAAWTQSAFVKAPTNGPGDQFGYTVALSGDTLAVAAPFEDSKATGIGGSQVADDSALNSGAVYVFARSGGAWTSPPAYLKASDTHAYDQFGWSLALDGTTLAVGAPFSDSFDGSADDLHTLSDSGTVYVFVADGGTWSQQAYIKASTVHPGDHFGWAVALSGDSLLVGAPFDDSSSTGLLGDPTDTRARDSGAAYLFGRTDGAWSPQVYIKPSDTFQFAWFGYGIGLSGDTMAVGAPQADSSSSALEQYDNSIDLLDGSGAVYIFR